MEKNMKQLNRWHNIIDEQLKLVYFWIFSIVFYSTFRLFLIYYFNQKLDLSTSANDILLAMIVGFKFDTHIIGLFLLIPFFANLLILTKNRDVLVKNIRLFFTYSFLLISILLFVITVTYFEEYNNQFNYFVFEALYDDMGAIINTILVQYNPIVSVLSIVILLFLSFYIMKYINTIKFKINFLYTNKIYLRIVILFVIILIFIISVRGKIDGKPPIRKWAYITQDEFLNKIVMNPTRTLIYAYKDFKKLQNNNTNPYLSKNNSISTIVKELYGKDINNNNYNTISNKIANGNVIEKPEHIVLVVMESYDSWPLQEKYKQLHISDNLHNIASKGIHFKNFLPIAHSTMNSLGSLVTGIPYAGVNISLIKSINGAEKTSIFEQMKKLGYDTYFFYGGFLSWQNIGNFMKNQGANHIFSAAHAGGKTKSGIWGIDDDQLFSIVEDKLSTKKKTFSIVMTTSYHGPFTIDVLKRGYPYKTNNDYPDKYKKLDDGSISANTLGHLWFSDYAVGDFVKKFEKQNPNTLFAFTGDHYGRRYFNNKPNLYELSSVPFILYGKSINKITIDESNIGNHLDIFPTIAELIAPKGFKYNSLGKSMLLNNNDITFGYKKALTKHSTYKVDINNGLSIWENNKNTILNIDELNKNKNLKSLVEDYKKIMAISWDITMNNYKFEK
jgi:phosphoglycerol transferase MdoB-like AlkP superfamily enzyme